MDKKNTRSRKYLLTINNPDRHQGCDHKSIFKKAQKFKTVYIAICDETGGKEHTYHSHVYLHYENAINFNTIKEMFPAANIATVRGTAEQSRHYLLKDLPEHNKKADGSYSYKDSTGKEHFGINYTDTFEEYGECPIEHQGRRTDLEHMYSLIKDGYSNAEVLELCGETAIRHIDKIDKLRLTYLTNKYTGTRRLDLKVHYITGKTGTGKSRDILDEFENAYRITDYQHPFDNYRSEPVIVYEEYRSSLRLQDMLNYLDIYPVTLPARYSPKVCCATQIFIVSNWAFELHYAELQKDPEQKSSYEAWVRRFNGYVKEYYAKGKYNFYPTMQDYLRRNEKFHPVKDESVPFVTEQTPKQLNLSESVIDMDVDNEPMPFD